MKLMEAADLYVTRRSATGEKFYSPAAMFYGNVAVYLDGIIDRVLNNAPSDERRRIGERRLQRPAF